MRIAFFGTPAPAVPYLEALHGSDHEIVAVVTQPDRPAGRGRKQQPSEVREAAERLGYEVLTPEKADDAQFIAQVRRREPDLGVVVAYGQILRRELLELPEAGFVNVHYSLLPKLRGAAPVYGALLEGIETTGVTVQRMVERLDAGDIILQSSIEIADDDDRGTLTDRLTEIGVPLLLEALGQIERGEAEPESQDESEASYVGRVTSADCRIDWNRGSEEIRRLVRACTPWPGAWCSLGGSRVKVQDLLTKNNVLRKEGTPGEIAELTDGGPVVRTGDGAVEMLRLQPAGKRSMSGAEFLRGARLEVGEHFG